MSVVVKGMKMPENCGRCNFNVSSLYCNRTGSEIDRDYEYRERLSDCPISALPDKHGRLVDADELRDRLRNLADDDWNANTTTTWSEAFSECDDMVDDAPIIVEAEDSE